MIEADLLIWGIFQIMVVDGNGVLCDLGLDQDKPKLYQLKTTKEETGDDKPCTWESVGFSATGWCYADNILLV